MPGRRRPVFAEGGQRFRVGRHLLRLVQVSGRWAASIDGLALGSRYPSQAEAWLEGVRAAMILDAQPPGPPPPAAGRAAR